MCSSIHHQLLQAELTRIEVEAAYKSKAIMQNLNALVFATELCAFINENNPEKFDADILYYGEGTTCSAVIFTRGRGVDFLKRIVSAGFSWEDKERAFEGHRAISINNIQGLKVFIKRSEIDQFEMKDAA